MVDVDAVVLDSFRWFSVFPREVDGGSSVLELYRGQVPRRVVAERGVAPSGGCADGVCGFRYPPVVYVQGVCAVIIGIRGYDGVVRPRVGDDVGVEFVAPGDEPAFVVVREYPCIAGVVRVAGAVLVVVQHLVNPCDSSVPYFSVAAFSRAGFVVPAAGGE